MSFTTSIFGIFNSEVDEVPSFFTFFFLTFFFFFISLLLFSSLGFSCLLLGSSFLVFSAGIIFGASSCLVFSLFSSLFVSGDLLLISFFSSSFFVSIGLLFFSSFLLSASLFSAFIGVLLSFSLSWLFTGFIGGVLIGVVIVLGSTLGKLDGIPPKGPKKNVIIRNIKIMK